MNRLPSIVYREDLSIEAEQNIIQALLLKKGTASPSQLLEKQLNLTRYHFHL